MRWSLHRRNDRRGTFRLLVVVLLVSVPTAAAAGAETDATGNDESPRVPATSASLVAQQTPTNNTTVERHQDPAADAERGNLSRVSTLLSASLGTRLGRSSLTLSRAQYELAKRFVGPEYREDLGRYVDVSARTRTESDDRLAEQFNETASTQRRLVDQLETFNETKRAYLEARQEGNEVRAEQLARELRRLADDIEETRTTVVEDYRVITRQTAADLSNESDVLNETVAERLAAAREIQRAEFSATKLEVSASTTEASFLTPVRLRGRILSNGSALAAEPIELEVGDRRFVTETDGNGSFTLRYRPVSRPLGTQTLRVRYIPSNESNRRTANDTVTVNVTQTNPEVDALVSPTEARFNDTLRITGTASAGGEAVPTAPVEIYLNGNRVATGETTREGRINETVSLSPRTPNGTLPIDVVVGAAEQSIGVGSDTESLTVLTSPSNLYLNATGLDRSGAPDERRTVVARGRLTAADGTPIAGEWIEIRVEGTLVREILTDENGFYRATVQVPPRHLPTSVGGEERVRIVAAYDGEGTNLERRSVTAFVLFQAKLLAVIGRNHSVVQTLTVILVIGSAVALRRRFDRSAAHDEAVTAATTPSDPGDPEDPSSTPPSFVELSRRSLEGDRPDTAVRFAYAAARATVSDAYDLETSGTHWEFFHACEDAGTGRLDELERLTALYESAAFDRRSLEAGAATEALSLAEEITGTFDGGDLDSSVSKRAPPVLPDGDPSDGGAPSRD
jgi:hypothetical protein